MPHMKAFGGNINIPASGRFVTGVRSDPGRTKSESPRLKQRRPVKTRPRLQTENTADRGRGCVGSNARADAHAAPARVLLGGLPSAVRRPRSAVSPNAPARRRTVPHRRPARLEVPPGDSPARRRPDMTPEDENEESAAETRTGSLHRGPTRSSLSSVRLFSRMSRSPESGRAVPTPLQKWPPGPPIAFGGKLTEFGIEPPGLRRKCRPDGCGGGALGNSSLSE